VFSLPFVARRVAAVVTGLSLATALAPAVLATPPTTPALNPEPPDFYACAATGGGTICRAHLVEPYELEPTGISCGTGAGAFEVLDSGTRIVDATRFYDGDGNLARRQRIVAFDDAHLTNPLTGATIGYHQHNTDWDVLGVPGDLSTSTWHGHGVLSVTFPGSGSILRGAGVTVVGPDGTLLHRGGLDEPSDYYSGDASVVADLCAALMAA
jgi:hypothetical protein